MNTKTVRWLSKGPRRREKRKWRGGNERRGGEGHGTSVEVIQYHYTLYEIANDEDADAVSDGRQSVRHRAHHVTVALRENGAAVARHGFGTFGTCRRLSGPVSSTPPCSKTTFGAWSRSTQFNLEDTR